MSLNVTIPDTFNGPLDLLLHLIRRDEMDIYDIPIARLTASYLEEMNRPGVVDVDEGAEFLDLASRLLEIKSRMLLPPEELAEDAEEEGEEEFDPRSGLVEALLEYRRFKDAAERLGEMAEEQARRYPRSAPRMEFAFVEPEAGEGGAGANDLLRAFQNLLDRMLPDFADAPDVITYTEVSIATRAEQITENLAALERTRFSRLLSDSPTKSEIVGLFIAVLELVRQGKIIARQTDNFSDIILERRVVVSGASPAAAVCVFFAPGVLFPVFAPIFSPGHTRNDVKKALPPPGIFPAPRIVLRRPRRIPAPGGLFPRMRAAHGKRPTGRGRGRND